MDRGFVTCWRISSIRLENHLSGFFVYFAEKESKNESSEKIASTCPGCRTSVNIIGDLTPPKGYKKDNVFRIGISQYITHKSLDATRKGFIEELKKEGDADGKNIQIDFQNAQGEQRNLKNISKQLAEESDLVFAIATPSAQSLANTTKSTPIVFSAVTDPLAVKLVKNLKEPGGNITGTSDQSEDAIATQVDMIKQVLPTAKTVGIHDTQSEPNSVVQKDNAKKKILEAKGYQVVEKTIPIVTM